MKRRLQRSSSRGDTKRVCRRDLPQLPVELWTNEIAKWLTQPCVDGTSTDVLALALACRVFYTSPDWRRVACRRMVIGRRCGDSRSFWQLEEQQQAMWDRLYAPHVEELVYHLPCHHDWSTLRLDAMTRLNTLDLRGNECGSLTWEHPFPATLRLLRLDDLISCNDLVYTPTLWTHCIDNDDLLIEYATNVFGYSADTGLRLRTIRRMQCRLKMYPISAYIMTATTK